MKIFFDTEFTGLHKNTTLISIGLVTENGKTFYAEFTDYDESQCDDWIKENVISHLSNKGARGFVATSCIDGINTRVIGNKSYVQDQLKVWFSRFNNEKIELVSDVCHYDMVLFIDIFGSAWDIPNNINPACHDINQDIARYYEIDEVEAFDYSREQILENCDYHIEGDKHNALYDAKVIKFIYELIRSHGV